LKAHYTPEFMAALLSSEIEDGNKRDILVEHIEDARRLGVAVLPPDVNASESDFTVVDDKILFGLTAIKGVGRGASAEIVRARTEGGPFRDLFDFCERVDLKIVPRSGIERLIKAGACDRFGRRAQLMHALPRASQAATETQQDRRAGQLSLFGAAGGSENGVASSRSPELPDIPEWPDSEKLKNEKEALDFYFSSHPLAQYADDLRHFATHTVNQLGNLAANQEVILGGVLTQIRLMNTKRARNGNTRYARCKLEDLTGAADCVMWPDDYLRHKDDFVEDRVCFVRGSVDRTREEPVLIVTRILSVEQAQRELTKGLVLSLRLGVHEPDVIDAIGRMLERARGSCPVFLAVRDPAGKRGLLKLGESYRINPASVPIADLEMLLGQGAVKFSGPVNGHARNGH
jgi:DNA polymerase-3 subunit alpha